MSPSSLSEQFEIRVSTTRLCSADVSNRLRLTGLSEGKKGFDAAKSFCGRLVSLVDSSGVLCSFVARGLSLLSIVIDKKESEFSYKQRFNAELIGLRP